MSHQNSWNISLTAISAKNVISYQNGWENRLPNIATKSRPF